MAITAYLKAIIEVYGNTLAGRGIKMFVLLVSNIVSYVLRYL